MKHQFKPFNTLEQKGIKKGKIILNIIICIMSVTIAIVFLTMFFTKAAQLNTYTQDAEKCRVLLTKEIYNARFSGSDCIQIVSKGEYVNLHPILKNNKLFAADDYFKLGKEYDAVLFYYQGEKTVHLKWMFLLQYFELIYFGILFAVAALIVATITYKRVKYSDIWRKKKIVTEKNLKVRRIVIFTALLFFLILGFSLDWRYYMIYNSIFYTILIVLGVAQSATDNYYIPLPTDKDTEISE